MKSIIGPNCPDLSRTLRGPLSLIPPNRATVQGFVPTREHLPKITWSANKVGVVDEIQKWVWHGKFLQCCPYQAFAKVGSYGNLPIFSIGNYAHACCNKAYFLVIAHILFCFLKKKFSLFIFCGELLLVISCVSIIEVMQQK